MTTILGATPPRPPRSPDFSNPTDVARWTKDLRNYLDTYYKVIVQSALEISNAQPLSPKLTAFDALTGTGAIEKTGDATYAMRAIGAGSAASLLTRSAGDARYVQESDAEGYVTGPASATDNALARFDAATGKLLQDCPVTIDDDGVMAGHRIGAWTSNADAAVNGYVTVTDDSGATRKLATIA